MSGRGRCEVLILPGFNRDGRGIAFLKIEGDRHVDAKSVYDRLGENSLNAVRTRFESWLDYMINDRWYHGWSHPNYRNCWVFKWKEKRHGRRLYGFLCNPREEDPSYQLCVLVLHAYKNEPEADTSELDRVVERSAYEDVAHALRALRYD